MAGWFQVNELTWKLLYAPYHTPIHSKRCLRANYAPSRDLSRMVVVQNMAIFGVKDWPLWRADSRAWIWPRKHFTGGTEQAFYFWQKKNKQHSWILNINYSIWKYRHCIKRITFQFCRPEDQMQTKYGSFQQIGPHADQICNCGPLCKYCICIAPYPKECFLVHSLV